jgi:hypothetical protein
MAVKPQTRKLPRAHFAFMRCLAQCLDERNSWDRLRQESGTHRCAPCTAHHHLDPGLVAEVLSASSGRALAG